MKNNNIATPVLQRPMKPLSDLELDEVLGHLSRTSNRSIYNAVLLAAHTGMRPWEIVHLQPTHIDLDRRILTVPLHVETRFLMCARMLQALRSWNRMPSGQFILFPRLSRLETAKLISKSFAEACWKVLGRRLCFQELRRYWAAKLVLERTQPLHLSAARIDQVLSKIH